MNRARIGSAKAGIRIRNGIEEIPIPDEIGRSMNPIGERFIAVWNADGGFERRGGGLEKRRKFGLRIEKRPSSRTERFGVNDSFVLFDRGRDNILSRPRGGADRQ